MSLGIIDSAGQGTKRTAAKKKARHNKLRDNGLWPARGEFARGASPLAQPLLPPNPGKHERPTVGLVLGPAGPQASRLRGAVLGKEARQGVR